MGKYYFYIIVFLLSTGAFGHAQTQLNSDTISLLSGKQEISFDIPKHSFRQVDLSLFLQLEESCVFKKGDYLSLQLDIDKPNPVGEKIEFARIYLPSYYKNRVAGNQIIYNFDLTLWQSLLVKNGRITVQFSGESPGLKMAFSFLLDKGEMPVKVLDIIPLWQSSEDGFPYGKNGVDAEYLPSRRVHLPELSASAFISIIVSGKSEDISKEQSARFYFLSVNNQEISKRSIWRDDCGLNPIFPQLEAWSSNHPNWCPGLRVNPLVHYLNKESLKQEDIKVDMRFQKDLYENSGVQSYITSAVLFALAEPTEKLNVSISEIIAPNIDLWHHRYNPICGNPIILIQNNGKETVNTITFNYGYNYQTDNKFRWKGELGFMEQEIVYLPSLNWYFYDKYDEPETFTAHISKVNGQEKAYLRGKKTSVMELADVFPYKLSFEIQTGDDAQYNGLEIFNEDGDIVYMSEELSDHKNYQFNLSLNPGCYEMIFYDEQGNGIKLPNSKASCLKVKDQKNGIVLKEYQGDFGLEIREQFMIFR